MLAPVLAHPSLSLDDPAGIEISLGEIKAARLAGVNYPPAIPWDLPGR